MFKLFRRITLIGIILTICIPCTVFAEIQNEKITIDGSKGVEKYDEAIMVESVSDDAFAVELKDADLTRQHEINATVTAKTDGNYMHGAEGMYAIAGNIKVTQKISAEAPEANAIGVEVDNSGSGSNVKIDVSDIAAECKYYSTGLSIKANGNDKIIIVNTDNIEAISTGPSMVSTGVDASVTGAGLNISVDGIISVKGTNNDSTGLKITNNGGNVLFNSKSIKTDYSNCYGYGARIKNYAGSVDCCVNGDISGTVNGVRVYSSNGTETSIYCDGTISGSQSAINIENAEVEDGFIDGLEIVVFELKTSNAETSVLSVDDSVLDQLSEDGKNSIITYIIKDSDSTNSYSKFTVGDGTTNLVTIGDKTYQTANRVTAAIVKVTAGYSLSSNKESTLFDNGDGTYSLTIPQEGGIILTATLIPVPDPEPDPDPKSNTSSGGGTSSIPKPTNTGSVDNPVRDGKWSMVDGKWQYTTNAKFVDTWGYIGGADENSEPHWYYFDKSGNMLTGWQQINGIWYYFSTAQDVTEGQLLMNTVTPDGYMVGPDGAWIQPADLA